MKRYLALDIGGTFVKYAIVDFVGNVLTKGKIKTNRDSVKPIFDLIEEHIEYMNDFVDGIAISMPGIIDSARGIAVTGGSLKYVDNTSLVDIIQQKFQIPTTIENDGKCAALAEKWLGTLKNVSSGLVIVFGSGIGGGIILNNELVRGNHFSAGEFSCMITNFKNPSEVNYWGNDNSTKNLLRKYSLLNNEEVAIGEVFFERLISREENAINLFREFTTSVAAGIYTLQAILDVEKIVIGGGISAQDILISEINNALDKQFEIYNGFPVNKPIVEACRFRNDANIIGAVKFHKDQFDAQGEKLC